MQDKSLSVDESSMSITIRMRRHEREMQFQVLYSNEIEEGSANSKRYRGSERC